MQIPAHLLQDRYWKPVLYLFQKHPKLSQCFHEDYFDLKDERIKAQTLKADSRFWSNGEKIMLGLALHLYNERYKFNLSDMDSLDPINLEMALQAIKLRFLR
ncbi:hypothetical protein [Brevibacillus massiliensis]|uniref:hypothetical protein n=1 Tax=Brevibacillus massiliensis TaxID=1118054 RepID=UPI00036FB8C9|nr:hypothetical protein [Brevibacillus massiliensis]